MGQRCNHHHTTEKEKPDFWTNFAAIGEYASSFISDGYWLAELFDIATGLSEDALGLSYYGITFGALMALLSAYGAAYSHRSLNTLLQKQEEKTHHGSECIPLVDKSTLKKETDIETGQAHTHLSFMQKLALAGDFLSHAGDRAGPITFVVNLATGNQLSRGYKALVQSATTLFGGLASVASVRSCKNAMLELAERKSAESESTSVQDSAM